MAVAPCSSSYETRSLIRASAQTAHCGSDPCWTDLDCCLSAKSFAFLALALCIFLFSSVPCILNQKRLICWAKEVCKWVRWNISYPELSTHRCLISHISDWMLLRCHARLKKPSCHSARWSQCDIFSTRQTEKWDGNICTKYFLHPVSPPPPLSRCQRPPLSSKLCLLLGTL